MHSDIHGHISKYLDDRIKNYSTPEFEYNDYNGPNTMYSVSNKIDEALLKLSNSGLRMWHRSLSRLKRNIDPVLACTLDFHYKYYSDLMSRAQYYRALKELQVSMFLIGTINRKVFIVSVEYASKMFKPNGSSVPSSDNPNGPDNSFDEPLAF